MRYYLIAGEASGDLHGAYLMQAIKAQDPKAEFRFWGGDHMAELGGEPVKHYRDLAFMGFVEVVMNLRTILGNIKLAKEDIIAFAPDRLILIDYPGFNLRIAKWARPAGLDISYYISPQIWAWHKSRVHQIKKNVDRMLVILPFEEDFYQRYDYQAHFVGHPLLDVIADYGDSASNSTKDQIALLPGSRRQEIKTMLPIMLAAAREKPAYEYVLAQAPAQEDSFYDQLLASTELPLRFRRVTGQTYALLASSRAAMVTSGTATLEAGLFEVPLVVCYKGNWLSYQIAKRLIDIKYISLVNLILDEPLLTELIQGELKAERLATELRQILDGPGRERQLAGLKRLKTALGEQGAPQRAAQLIIADQMEPKTTSKA
ncbi:MAG: lipid-A-disaccharide synthase [Bacteroidota bacterium]